MPLPRSPEGASEINRGCDPWRTRSLTQLSPAPWRGAGHRSRLVSSPSAFSRAPAGRREEEVDPHEPGVTPPAISLTPLRGVPPFPPAAVLRTGFRKRGTSFSDSLSLSLTLQDLHGNHGQRSEAP